jgi:hypothetical protein
LRTYTVTLKTKTVNVTYNVMAPDKQAAGNIALTHQRTVMTNPSWSCIPKVVQTVAGKEV